MRKSKVYDLRSGAEIIHRESEVTLVSCAMCREEGSEKKKSAVYCGLPLDYIKSTGVLFEKDNSLTQIDMANLFISAYARTKDVEIDNKDTAFWYKNERPKLRWDFLRNINNGMNSEAIRFILAQTYFEELYLNQKLGAAVFEDPSVEGSKFYMQKLDSVLQNETCQPYETLFSTSAQIATAEEEYDKLSSKNYAYLNTSYLNKLIYSIKSGENYIKSQIEKLGLDMVEDVLNDRIAVARLHDRNAFLEYNIRNGQKLTIEEIPQHLEGLEEERVLVSSIPLKEAIEAVKEQSQDMQR